MLFSCVRTVSSALTKNCVPWTFHLRVLLVYLYNWSCKQIDGGVRTVGLKKSSELGVVML